MYTARWSFSTWTRKANNEAPGVQEVRLATHARLIKIQNYSALICVLSREEHNEIKVEKNGGALIFLEDVIGWFKHFPPGKTRRQAK